ncbi:MAG: hypothetical protein EBR20_08985 [Bacteroidetes bacterium]|nr:hypothetical protein [Bacteroidota bacterium]
MFPSQYLADSVNFRSQCVGIDPPLGRGCVPGDGLAHQAQRGLQVHATGQTCRRRPLIGEPG